MPENAVREPQLTMGQSANPDGFSTLDVAGAYHPSLATLPIVSGPTGELPGIAGYAITGEIARGGMGRVLAGRELALDREVAIKVLLPGANAARFVTESKITAKLPHPNIPPVYALGALADGSPFLAMKYVRGRTLADELNDRADLKADLPRFLQIFEQIAQAVGFAHSRGIIHRDLKPANVMVGEFGEVQVMDWGLARGMGSAESGARSEDSETGHPEMTQVGAIMGTPAYMAPEQARGEVADARADVFALGGVLFELLTGERPWGSGQSAVLVARAANGSFDWCHEQLAGSGADAELIAVSKHCLQADRGDRPSDGLAVANLLRNYRNGVEERLKAAEKERSEAIVREAELRKRRRLFTRSAAAVVLVLVAGSAVSFWQADEAKTAAKNEATQKKIADEKAALATLEAERATQAEGETAAQLTKTEQARKEAVVNERMADLRVRQLLESTSTMVFDLQNKLENRPGTQDIRKALLENARDSLAKIIDDARKQGTPDRTLVWSHFRMGGLEVSLGNTPAARKEYQLGCDLAKRLAEADPANVQAQRDLSTGYVNLGDAERQLGRTKEARGFYEIGRQISQRLADADPNSAQAERDLGGAIVRLGDLSLQLGRTKEALEHYRKYATACLRLAEADPKNVRAQRDLALGYDRVGDVTLRLGMTAEAGEYYQKALEVRKRLADPRSTQAQRDLAVSNEKLGNLALRLGRGGDALEYFQKYGAACLRLADADPTNAQMQLELCVCYARLGDATLLLGQTERALGHYRKYVAGCQFIADADPTHAQAQRHLSVGCDLLGDVNHRLGNADALGFYRKGLEIRRRLADSNPKDIQALTDVFISFHKLGSYEKKRENHAEAAAHFEEGRRVLVPLHEKGLLVGQFENAVAQMDEEIRVCKAEQAKPKPKPREILPPPRSAPPK